MFCLELYMEIALILYGEALKVVKEPLQKRILYVPPLHRTLKSTFLKGGTQRLPPLPPSKLQENRNILNVKVLRTMSKLVFQESFLL